jgi:hypothetical protein
VEKEDDMSWFQILVLVGFVVIISELIGISKKVGDIHSYNMELDELKDLIVNIDHNIEEFLRKRGY